MAPQGGMPLAMASSIEPRNPGKRNGSAVIRRESISTNSVKNRSTSIFVVTTLAFLRRSSSVWIRMS